MLYAFYNEPLLKMVLQRRAEELAPIIQNRVNDRIYDEFNIEEEEVYGAMKSENSLVYR